MTEADRQEKTEEMKGSVRDEPKEATRYGDREKGGAEEVNPEGEGTAGGVKENVQTNLKRRNETNRLTINPCNAVAGV